MPRHKPKPKRNEYIGRGFGDETGDPRITPPPIILAGNRLEHQKRKAHRLMVEEGQVHGEMEVVIRHNMDPEGIVPKWLKGANGSKERR